MTNKQKAENITKGFFKEGLIKKSRIQELLIKAMDWKDKQYNEEKRDLLGLVKMLKIDEQNQTIIEDLVAILES